MAISGQAISTTAAIENEDFNLEHGNGAEIAVPLRMHAAWEKRQSDTWRKTVDDNVHEVPGKHQN